MSRWAIALQQLGEQINMPALAFNDNGRLTLETTTGRCFAAETVGDGLLIYASDPTPYDGPNRLLRAWKRTYLHRLNGRPVQTALREHDGVLRLFAVVRLQTDECSAHALRGAIDDVSRWLDSTRQP
ncbi:hypothetical protein [Bordetella tumulicola]|uniref:hypothetical protein n=1 Tax=Bordetella tumulicola TaxID=1649133 RepID=UPI0039EF81FA